MSTTIRLLTLGVVAALLAGSAAATTRSLQQAIAACDVDATRTLLDAGADPNAVDARKQAVVGWLASGTRCGDADALAVARLLESHGATFAASGLLSNLAPRHLPRTLAFLAAKHGTGDPTAALRVIARDDDVDSIRALLDAGADPTAGIAKSSALLDAAAADRADIVAEMLGHVTDKQSAKVFAAYDAAARDHHADVTRAFTAAGVVPPPTSTATAPCAPQDLEPADVALLTKLGLPNAHKLAGLAGPMECKRIQTCGDLVLIDCNSAADGPAYYLDRKTETVLATCGGACMAGCTNCPPKQWTCGCAR